MTREAHPDASTPGRHNYGVSIAWHGLHDVARVTRLKKPEVSCFRKDNVQLVPTIHQMSTGQRSKLGFTERGTLCSHGRRGLGRLSGGWY